MWYNSVMNIPADDFILLSVVNTKLRDEYPSLTAFCDEEEVSAQEIVLRLAKIGYKYDEDGNSFIYGFNR